jgi:hypothetical protein
MATIAEMRDAAAASQHHDDHGRHRSHSRSQRRSRSRSPSRYRDSRDESRRNRGWTPPRRENREPRPATAPTPNFLIVRPEGVELTGTVHEENVEVYLRGMTRQESLTRNFATLVHGMLFVQSYHTDPSRDREAHLFRRTVMDLYGLMERLDDMGPGQGLRPYHRCWDAPNP